MAALEPPIRAVVFDIGETLVDKSREHLLRRLDLPADVVVTSADWGVRKPAPEFFARAVHELLGDDADPATVVHVGDQLAADVTGACAAGLRAIRVLQGPWGRLQRDPEVGGDRVGGGRARGAGGRGARVPGCSGRLLR